MFKNPFSFEGRIRRLEYFFGIIISWLAYSIITSIISLILYFLLGGLDESVLIFILWILYFPVHFFSLTQIVKRSHDVGRSGNTEFILFAISYFFLPGILLFIPFNLYLLFKAGEKGPNKYGDDPKGVGNTSQSGGGFTPPNNPQYPTGGYQNGNNFGGYNRGYNNQQQGTRFYNGGYNAPQTPPQQGGGFYNGGHNANPQQWQQQGQQPQGGGFYNGGHNANNQPNNFPQRQPQQTPPQPKRGGGKDFDGNLYGKAN